MRPISAIALASSLALLSACGIRSTIKDYPCYALAGVSRLGQSLQLTGDLHIDQHGDFVRPPGCIGPAIRVYGISTANGAAADQLRKDIDSTLTLFEVHWVIDSTARVERDEDGLILRILSIRSAKRVDDRPNNSVKPKPLRGSA
jgi:hypothetical protein